MLTLERKGICFFEKKSLPSSWQSAQSSFYVSAGSCLYSKTQGLQFSVFKIKRRCGWDAVQFSESPWGQSQVEDCGRKAFHILKDIEVPLPGELKYLRDLLENSLSPHKMVGIRLRERVIPSEKFCFCLHYNLWGLWGKNKPNHNVRSHSFVRRAGNLTPAT